MKAEVTLVRTARPDYERDVRKFHAALAIPAPQDGPEFRRQELRVRLIEEEADELVDAISEGDMVKTIDGLCDLLVVTFGTIIEFGIDIAPFWREVHRTNMAKAGGPVREDGKVLKPEGWTPPDIRGILERQFGWPEGVDLDVP